MRSYGKLAGSLNEQIRAAEKEQADAGTEQSGMLTLQSENEKDKLSFPVEELLYIEAADNYVKIHFTGNEVLQHRVLRSSLKRREEMLATYSQVYRCHRAYMVNLNKLVHISGNAQGYKLHLAGIDEPIPVSRSLNRELAGKISR